MDIRREQERFVIPSYLLYTTVDIDKLNGLNTYEC